LARDIQREEAAEDSSGYFWDRPQELRYLLKNSLDLSEEDFQKMANDFAVEDAARLEATNNNFYGENEASASAAGERGYESTGLSDGYGFASFPQSPDAARIHRSNAAKKMWQDEAFRNKWYNARWGEDYQLKEAHAAKVQERVENLPPEMLRTEEFQSLSMEDIVHAVQVYRSANEKRSISHRLYHERIRNRKKMGGVSGEVDDDLSVGNNKNNANMKPAKMISFLPSEEEQRALQKRRAEKSRKAYQTRRIKLEAAAAAAEVSLPSPALKKLTQEEWSWKDSASHALYRAEAALDSGRVPEIRDVELMMKRERLKDRRFIYRRIIKECLGLKGKCVYDPDLYEKFEGLDDDNVELYFPTHCPIELVGRFIVHKLKERNE